VTLTHLPKNRVALAGFMLMSLARGAHAEDVRWRADYASARAEAVRLDRPLVLVVESSSCGWCRKLEQTTLRDGRVVRALNASAIPLRLSADDPAHAELLDALRVEGLPTIAGVAPDGRVVANQAGFLDAKEFLGVLRDVHDKIERPKESRGEGRKRSP